MTDSVGGPTGVDASNPKNLKITNGNIHPHKFNDLLAASSFVQGIFGRRGWLLGYSCARLRILSGCNFADRVARAPTA
jgi:hypothetical protein